MNRDKVLQVIEYVKGSPETMNYGRWGALNREQRFFIAYLCESWLILDDATNIQTKEIERLNNIINKVIKYIKEYCIDDEFYINLSNKEKGIIEVLTILENGSDKE